MPTFQPRYLALGDLATFGLPDTTEQANIMNLVDAASTLIDEYCGRTDGDGNGSLVYTTYTERLLLPVGRNLVRTMFRPLAAVTPATKAALAQDDSNDKGHFDTGFTPNTLYRSDNVTLSPILSASGRYGYGRRAGQAVYPDLNMGANLLQVASFFGGPPNFTPIDVASIDFDIKTGELWLPAGLYLSQYTEVVVTYNSGFDPTDPPNALRHACAALVKNMLVRGGGTTGLKSYSMYRASSTFSDMLIDATVDQWLNAYKTVVAY